MPGAGDEDAGMGPAGFESVADPSTAAGGIRSRAAYFDLRTRSMVLGADGRLVETHPIDQRVAVLLGVPMGGVKSTPEIDEGRVTIESSADPALLAKVKADVLILLADLIANGDIVVERIEAESPVDGRIEKLVAYRNLRAVGDQRRTFPT
jgi:hypothetical protein